VVVQRTRVVQRLYRHVDGGHAGLGMANVGRQFGGIARLGQRPFVQRLQDAGAPVLPHMAKVGAPAQLVDKLVLHV